MSYTQSLTCCIIGDDNITLQCAKILIEKGYTICSIISSNTNLQTWAREKHIPYVNTLKKLVNNSLSYDYLFSIVNHEIISSSILNKISKFAINYHDSPLPTYAGVHSTSWAIMNNEKYHGITWHLINDIIDGGDILKQITFPISKNETALSLNLKCCEQALLSFEELTDELKDHKITPRSQDLTKRSYYGAYQKPTAMGLIDWNHSAEKIDQLIRALIFGNYPNRLTTAKFIAGKEVFIIKKIKILNITSKKQPGSIVKIANKHVQVATGTNDILILETSLLRQTSCIPIEFDKYCRANKIKKLSSPDQRTTDMLAQYSPIYSKMENFWLTQVIEQSQAKYNFIPVNAQKNRKQIINNINTINITQKLHKEFSGFKKLGFSSLNILISAFFIYLYRLNNYEKLTINFNLKTKLQIINKLYSNNLPISVHSLEQKNTEQIIEEICLHINKLNVPYPLDIIYRYPLANLEAISSPIEVIISNKINKIKINKNSILAILISEDGKKIRLVYKQINNYSGFDYTFKNMPQHLINIIKEIHKDIKIPIANINFLTKPEYKKLLFNWINTETHYPYNKNLSELFEEQARKHPNHIAIIQGREKITYQQLNMQANKIKNYLLSQDISSNSLIVTYFERNIEAIATIIAIIKAGGTYVTIDQNQPKARTKSMLDTIKPHIILTETKFISHLKLLAAKEAKLIDTNNIEAYSDQNTTTSSSSLSSDSVAYIMFTSGSTGIPKGIKITHKAIIRLIRNTNYIHIKSNDNIAQASNMAFDASTFEIWGALLNGATLTIIDYHTLLTYNKLESAIELNKITIFWLTTTLFNQIANESPKVLNSLKTILVGGEALNPDITYKFLKEIPNKKLRLLNCYGPTENTTFTTSYLVNKSKLIKSVPIGKPISNTKVYILDRYLKLMPIGIIGEIYISGDGLAQGYFNNQKLTEQKFIPNPHNEKCNNWIYQTGDLAYWLPDGIIDYVGRTDTQIKIRGFRIEIKEIESIMLKFPGIKQAAIILEQTNNTTKKMYAFFTITHNKIKSETILQLQKFLSKHLPKYMLPTNYLVVKSIPLTPNNKIDNEKLLEHKLKLENQIKHSKTQVNTTEKQLINIWKKVLGLAYISPYDDFFKLGGDSIIAMQIIAKANEAGLRLSIKNLFDCPNIAGLAKLVNRQEEPAINIKLVANNIALTPIQKWFFEQQLKQKEQWCQVCLLKANQIINKSLFEHALNNCIKQYNTFSLKFKNYKNSWIQTHDNINKLNITLHEIIIKKSQNVKKFINNISIKIQTDIKLECPPLLRAYLISSDDKSSQHILIAIHHLIIDGVSWRIFLNDLNKVYIAFLNSGKIKYQNKITPYSEWSKAISAYAKKDILTKESNYWLKILQTNSQIPIDKQTGPNIEKFAKSISYQLTSDKTEFLYNKAINLLHCSFNEMLLTALAQTLCPWFKKSDILINLESHGRSNNICRSDLSKSIGWFTALYPFNLKYSPNGLEENIRLIKESLRSIPNTGIGYGILRHINHNKAFIKHIYPQISFNYWGKFNNIFDDSTFELCWLNLISAKKNLRPHLIDINIIIKDKKLHVSWNYSKNHYKDATIRKLAKRFLQILKRFSFEHNRLNEIYISSDFTLAKLHNSQLTHLNSATKDILPLAPIQSGILFHNLQDGHKTAYFTQVKISIHKQCCINTFKQALKILTERYDILRTSISHAEFGKPLQIISNQIIIPIKYYNFENILKTLANQRIEKIISRDREKLFDLNTAPLYRAIIIKLTEHEYYFIFTFHHIICDGWSISILLSELELIYKFIIEKQTIKLPPAKQFSEYIKLINNYNYEALKPFWVKYLSNLNKKDLIDFIATSTSNHDISQGSHNHATLVCELNKHLSNDVKNFSMEKSFTLNTLIQTAWGIILFNITGITDIIFGNVIANRNLNNHNFEKTVGILINTLPIRIKIKPKLTLNSMLKEIQENFGNIIAHSTAPLSSIISWLPIKDNPSIFNSILAFENYPGLSNSNTNLFNKSNIDFWDPTHYQITISVFVDKHIKIKICYHNSINENIIHNISKAFEIILRQTIVNPNCDLISLSRLLNFNLPGTKKKPIFASKKFELTDCIEAFKKQLELNPSGIALVYNETTLTYLELDILSNKIANFLIKQGIQICNHVAVVTSRDLNSIAILLAVLKTGAIYIPIEASYPIERINNILLESKPLLIVINEKYTENFAEYENKYNKVISFKNLLSLSSNEKNLKLKDKVKLDNPAYIIFTSGSTGNPKGVIQTHLTIANLINWQINSFCNPPHKITHLANICFDVSLQEILCSLAAGSALHIVSNSMRNNISNLTAYIIYNKITHLFLPTSLLTLIADELNRSNINTLPLKEIIVAGEQLKITSSIKQLFKNHPYLNLINQYGPTETHVATSYKLPNNIKDWPNIPPIGKPISNIELFILNEQLQPVEDNSIGEIYIAGSGLAKAYINQSALTREKFIKNPFNSKEKLYKTGDLAYRITDGNFIYSGRIDNQFKFCGNRIEPIEIEHALLKYPNISNTAVVLTEYGDFQYIVAYIVPSNYYKEIKLTDLKSFLKTLLPTYMIPTHYKVVAEIPLTENGKIDRNLLPKVDFNNAKTNTYQPNNKNSSSVEKMLITIWEKILGNPIQNINIGFFELGGHSLSALHLLSMISRYFGVDLTITDILNNSSVNQLANKIQQTLDFKNQGNMSLNRLPSIIIPLKQDTNQPPIFLIHPVGGSIFWYITLSKYLNVNHSIFAIQDPGLELVHNIFSSINDMAKYYLSLIKHIQPCGPYLLAGASAGATIAIEIALELQKLNEDIAFVGLLDGWANYPDKLNNRKIFEEYMKKQFDEQQSYFHQYGLDDFQMLKKLQWQRAQLILNHHIPLNMNLKLTLFKAAESLPIFNNNRSEYNFWESHSLYPIERHIVAGNHETMFLPPNVYSLASILGSIINKNSLTTVV